jgi:predicted alpha/beta hydrolase family esterase
VLHGWTGSGPDHWQTWLARRLAERGEKVAYPALPRPDEPRLDEWLEALREELARLGGERVVLCHSLACILWLQHARSTEERVDRVLLVAPPSPSVELPGVEGFFPLEVTAEDVGRAAASTRLVCAPADPYCPEGADTLFGRPLGLPTDVVPGGSHLNTDAGYGPWPAVEEWCLTGRARFA